MNNLHPVTPENISLYNDILGRANEIIKKKLKSMKNSEDHKELETFVQAVDYIADALGSDVLTVEEMELFEKIKQEVEKIESQEKSHAPILGNHFKKLILTLIASVGVSIAAHQMNVNAIEHDEKITAELEKKTLNKKELINFIHNLSNQKDGDKKLEEFMREYKIESLKSSSTKDK